MKMERIESSETSALKTQTPGDYPKNTIRHSTHGESLKSSNILVSNYTIGYQKMNSVSIYGILTIISALNTRFVFFCLSVS